MVLVLIIEASMVLVLIIEACMIESGEIEIK